MRMECGTRMNTFLPALHLCMTCGAGVISDTQISLDINECPKVSVTNKCCHNPRPGCYAFQQQLLDNKNNVNALCILLFGTEEKVQLLYSHAGYILAVWWWLQALRLHQAPWVHAAWLGMPRQELWSSVALAPGIVVISGTCTRIWKDLQHPCQDLECCNRVAAERILTREQRWWLVTHNQFHNWISFCVCVCEKKDADADAERNPLETIFKRASRKIV